MADEQQLAFSARVSKPGTSGDTETPTSNPTCPGPYLYEADLSRANLSGAKLIDADLRFAHLYKADLSGADLFEAIFSGANLSWADLSGVNLSEANLQGALFVRAQLVRADLTGCRVYGISAWDLDLEGAMQKDLIITKVVLILGRFTDERKAVLDALREELRRRDYTPVLFDFDKPASKDLTGTVQTLANMARFVIADQRTRAACRTSWP